MTPSRRAFLRAGALAGGALAFGPLRALEALAQTAGDPREINRRPGVGQGPHAPEEWGAGAPREINMALRAPGNAGLGALRPAGRELALPPGFRYLRFGATGVPLTNGNPTPAAHDGMAAFPGPGGTIRLVRNHEENRGRPFGGRAYDPAAAGGTTNLVFDPRAGLVAAYPSLTGTLRNCGGGPTPWGTWLSAEETTAGLAHGFRRPHGYCFEVPSWATSPVQASPLKAMGRFKHEAVCVDPATGIVYETEDQEEAGVYRFLPNKRGVLAAGGRLQMLALDGRPGFSAGDEAQPGMQVGVHWVDIGDPDPGNAGENEKAVFDQGRRRGGAAFRRLEGCYWHQGRAVIISTTGGRARMGQVWEYRPGPRGGQLRLAFQSPSSKVLRMADNVTSAPWGGLLFCEDGRGPDHLRGLTRNGKIFDLARNRFSDGEFAGATFSPDGSWLFVNVQRPGVTFAITGPWAKIG
ncbi:MAG: alkaline phosphatase PhoX [Acidimicrobiia bacterium]